MKPTFTPGPWHVVNAGPHYNNKAIDNLQIQYGNDGECISDHVYEVADAHLIAAAPELLDAMELLFEITKNDIPVGASKVVYDAIAKARGEIK